MMPEVQGTVGPDAGLVASGWACRWQVPHHLNTGNAGAKKILEDLLLEDRQGLLSVLEQAMALMQWCLQYDCQEIEGCSPGA